MIPAHKKNNKFKKLAFFFFCFYRDIFILTYLYVRIFIFFVRLFTSRIIILSWINYPNCCHASIKHWISREDPLPRKLREYPPSFHQYIQITFQPQKGIFVKKNVQSGHAYAFLRLQRTEIKKVNNKVIITNLSTSWSKRKKIKKNAGRFEQIGGEKPWCIAAEARKWSRFRPQRWFLGDQFLVRTLRLLHHQSRLFWFHRLLFCQTEPSSS